MKTVYQTLALLALLFIPVFASAQVPILNSYVSSTNVIFLDFDGHTVTGTSWNYSGDIECNDASITAAQITSVFNRVAEDYRPFTVNITTDSAKYDSAPADRRMRVVFTTSSSWYGNAGGVAYINSFTWGDNTPCFIFTALLNHNEKNIAEAASHEIGHTLGLRHQASYDTICNKLSEYHLGRGTGEIGWAPIMGVGYYQNMTLWNYGANPFGCTNYQDDLSIITSRENGITFRPDDYGNKTSNALAVSFTNNNFKAGGIIEKPGDADVIKFSMSSYGPFKLTASPYSASSGNAGSNIDLQVELLNASANVIGTYNSVNTLDARIDTILSPGEYFLRVQGKGNIYAPNYASLGSYTLLAEASPGTTLPLHKLQLKGVTENKQHNLSWEIIADEAILTQTIEVSANGSSFQPVASFNGDTRKYYYLPQSNNVLYYRLKVTLENGRQHYSNVVALALHNNASNGRPYLAGNVVTQSLRINSPYAFSYSINDITGRTIEKGNLAQGVNTIHPSFSASGLYVIQYQNGAEVYTEKFIKQ